MLPFLTHVNIFERCMNGAVKSMDLLGMEIPWWRFWCGYQMDWCFFLSLSLSLLLISCEPVWLIAVKIEQTTASHTHITLVNSANVFQMALTTRQIFVRHTFHFRSRQIEWISVHFSKTLASQIAEICFVNKQWKATTFLFNYPIHTSKHKYEMMRRSKKERKKVQLRQQSHSFKDFISLNTCCILNKSNQLRPNRLSSTQCNLLPQQMYRNLPWDK